MPLPFVSRELYNRVCADLERSERERKELLDRLLGVQSVSLAEILPDPKSKEAEDLLDKTTGVLSIAAIRDAAQTAANRRAGRV